MPGCRGVVPPLLRFSSAGMAEAVVDGFRAEFGEAGLAAGRPIVGSDEALPRNPWFPQDFPMSVPTEFKNVTAVTKANIYFEGRVVSHTLHFPDGSKRRSA